MRILTRLPFARDYKGSKVVQRRLALKYMDQARVLAVGIGIQKQIAMAERADLIRGHNEVAELLGQEDYDFRKGKDVGKGMLPSNTSVFKFFLERSPSSGH